MTGKIRCHSQRKNDRFEGQEYSSIGGEFSERLVLNPGPFSRGVFPASDERGQSCTSIKAEMPRSPHGEAGSGHGTAHTGFSGGPDAAIFSGAIAGASVGIFIITEIALIVGIDSDATPRGGHNRTIGWGREYSGIGKDGEFEAFFRAPGFLFQQLSLWFWSLGLWFDGGHQPSKRLGLKSVRGHFDRLSDRGDLLD